MLSTTGIKHNSATGWIVDVAAGNVPGWKLIDKWGRNGVVGAALEPIVSETLAGDFWHPIAASTIRIAAGGNAADSAAGLGAQKINVQGLDENYLTVNEDIITAGAGASASTTTTFTRVFRAFVTEVGTYRGTNTAEMLIENTAGTEDIITVDGHDGNGQGQSLHCQYSAPANTNVYLAHFFYNVDSTKVNDVHLKVTDDISIVSAPFGATRTLIEFEGVVRDVVLVPNSPILLNKPGITTPSDIWIEGKVSSATSIVTARMQLLIQSTDGAF
jgi:hypothetical protein